MSPELSVGVVVALVSTLGTLAALGVIALFIAALRRVFPAEKR